MPTEPHIPNLSMRQRSRLFWVLVVLFVLLLPAMIFHTTGYRLTLVEDKATIAPTGGVYITTTASEVEVFVDELRVQSPRLFRSAYYIQTIPVGQRRVVVQGEGVQTWVKELPVDAYLVTEAAAFTMPSKPMVRPIFPWLTATGTPVYQVEVLPDWLATFATSAVSMAVSTSSATSTWQENQEYDFIMSLFSTSSVRTSVLQPPTSPLPRFRFADLTKESEPGATSSVYSVVGSTITLIEADGEVYARWTGTQHRIPYYFCTLNTTYEELVVRYGTHVADQVVTHRQATTTQLIPSSSGRVCRPFIKLDRQKQDVFWFDFVPGTQDLVLMLRTDGLYVTEIDDRAWQNSQLILTGASFEAVVYGGQVYVRDGEWLAEVKLTIES